MQELDCFYWSACVNGWLAKYNFSKWLKGFDARCSRAEALLE